MWTDSYQLAVPPCAAVRLPPGYFDDGFGVSGSIQRDGESSRRSRESYRPLSGHRSPSSVAPNDQVEEAVEEPSTNVHTRPLQWGR